MLCAVFAVCSIMFAKQIVVVYFNTKRMLCRDCAIVRVGESLVSGFIVYLCKVLSAFVYYFMRICIRGAAAPTLTLGLGVMPVLRRR